MKRLFAIIEYLFIIGIAVLFMLFLDGPGGGYLLVALVSAALISVSLCIYTWKSVSASVSVSDDILNKGDKLTLNVVLQKNGIFPTTFVEISLFSGFRLKADSPEKARFILFGKEKTVFSVDYDAEVFGKCVIGLDKLTVTDFFGLISFDIPVGADMRSEIRIYPDIPNVSGRDGLARSLADSAAFEESEETTTLVYSIGGVPGYEHRKYEPGDNLRLINWKLSAKRGELLVRRMEGASSSGQVIVLDSVSAELPQSAYYNDDDMQRAIKQRALNEQLVIEAMLGLTLQFIKTELPATIIICFDGVWEEVALVDVQNLNEFRYRLTDYYFTNGGARLPAALSDDRAVIFTSSLDDYIRGYLSDHEGVCAAAASDSAVGKNVWKIERDNSDIKFIS